jgi:hypothetical protein
MTMPSLTFLDKTSMLIPRSKAFPTRPRYCLPFRCQDKEWRNSAFHEPVSAGYVCHDAHGIHKVLSVNKKYSKQFKVYFKNLDERGSTFRYSETWNNWETLRPFRPLPPRRPRPQMSITPSHTRVVASDTVHDGCVFSKLSFSILGCCRSHGWAPAAAFTSARG